MSSSYERRNDAEYSSELGNALVTLARTIPNGASWTRVWISRVGPLQSRRLAKVTTTSSGKNASSNQYVFPQVPASYYVGSSYATSTSWKMLLAVKSVKKNEFAKELPSEQEDGKDDASVQVCINVKPHG